MPRNDRGKWNRHNQRGGDNLASCRDIPLNNTFASLASADQDDGERNAHIREQFRGAFSFRNNAVPDDDIPTARPLRDNNDIREYFRLAKQPVVGGAWLEKPEIPHSSEILREKPRSNFNGDELGNLIDVDESLRPHRPEGAYENTEDYLRTKSELLREDAILPLRKVVDEVRLDPFKDESEYENQGIGIYDPVYITSLVFSTRGLATRVAFSLSRVKKQIRWEQSKRLIAGTLVALSPTDDAFQTECIIATVAARPLSQLRDNPLEIDLFFARPEDQEIDPMRKWIMVECRDSFFEASRHTLTALQHLRRETFPLSKYLVDAQKEVDAPRYVKHNPFLNLSSLVSMEESADFESVDVLQSWPASSTHSLDGSQGKALRRMLTSELAIIQGPPGTGKTFVSVVALQILRDNLHKDDAPIIVTAQTNHALDQLLRHTSQFEPNFIRLGGMSKDAEIKKRTLYEIRMGLPQQKQPGSQKGQAMNAIRRLTVACQFLLQPLELGRSPMDHELLLKLGLITKEQAESLELESQCRMGSTPTNCPSVAMEQWLGKSLALCSRPILPDDYEWGYEEEDLEVEQLAELEAETVARDDEDDIDALRGTVVPLCDNYTGKGGLELSSADIRALLRKTDDLTTIRAADRGAVYNYFKREVKRLILVDIRQNAKAYEKNVLQFKVGRWEEDARVLRNARIIGCTTTGLSKYRALLSALRPRVCLVEEAAETLEAPVTAACFPSLEHLILVGDHQQLRPHTHVKAFEDEPYYLNVSLFERLVWNKVEFSTLKRQRRMIPEIRRLLFPIYEDTLKDHDSVKDLSNRPPVEGMGGTNTFFFSHDWPESRDANMSALNEREADMLVGFFDYLVLNDVEPYKITVLTYYNGQRKAILRKLNRHSNESAFRGVKVVTVDSYQGEENDIVLLSLVRSNRHHQIGFLSSENRACVALSRAKRGFYIFGNAELLACESGTWGSVVHIMFEKGRERVKIGQLRRIGYQFPLVCSNHRRKIWIESPDDWDLIRGGCDLKCDALLPCGHHCPYRCHPFEHERMNCMQQCTRRVETCGHPCFEICCNTCKCKACENRNNGTKSILKQAPGGGRSSRAAPRTRNFLPNSGFQRPSNPPPPSRTPQTPESTVNQWHAYANGGVYADDVRMHQLRMEEAARFEASNPTATPPPGLPTAPPRLVEISPVSNNGTNSANANLLLDLDVDAVPQPQQPGHRTQTVSRGGVASEGQGSAVVELNLLD